MVKAIASFGLALTLPLLLGGALSIHLFVTTSQSAPLTVQAARNGHVDAPLATRSLVKDPRGWKTPRVEPLRTIDLYGNEVTDAVAEYTVDRTGSLYELHSPQTELPRLGIPKS